jgi:rod shape-determining protein MreC
VSRAAQAAVQPLANVLSAIANGLSDFALGVARANSIVEQNRFLENKVRASSIYREMAEALSRENAELRRLLSLPKPPGRDWVPASLQGFFPLENRVTISVGSAQGIKRGMPVIAADGLLGKVQTVSPHSAQVLLVTSPRLSVGATVRRDPAPIGILRGESPDALILEHLDFKATILVGDVVVTSGLSELTPAGIPIGTVVKIEEDPAYGSRVCRVFPNVQVGTVRNVYVLK